MRKSYSIYDTYSAIRKRLADYIKSDYLANSETLLKYTDELVGGDGVHNFGIAREPYIETAAAYKKSLNGIINADIDVKVKKVLSELTKENLGFYENPFTHQIQALEAFARGKDIFVSTGTGSGKTECFMWPIIYKALFEAIYSPNVFKNNAVRTLIIYPMNALVSDQLARFRKMLGSENFKNIFANATKAARIPCFGMYTGRTAYSGDSKSIENKRLAEAFKKNYIVNPTLPIHELRAAEERLAGLKRINKYPAKYGEDGLKRFIENLENGIHTPNPFDAELITRFETQRQTPDILITNYSMLEYMLMRKREAKIWSDTAKWLNESADNKLLIVLDEAHMYQGSSGGEIALLLTRLFSRLGADEKKIQFIIFRI